MYCPHRIAATLALLAGPIADFAGAQSLPLVESINHHSPTVSVLDSLTGQPITPADVLAPFGGAPSFAPAGPPGILFDGTTLGLALHAGCVGSAPGVSCGIEVDALSDGRDTNLVPGDPFWYLYWSVDEYATGSFRPTRPTLWSEAPTGESAADVFVTEFTGPGPWGPPAGPPPVHVGAVDGDGLPSGIVAYPGVGLQEPCLPSGVAPPDTGDDVDALIVRLQLPVPRLYFSLAGGLLDPDQGWLPLNSAAGHGFFPGDVLVTPLSGAAPLVYASFAQLGLTSLDDVDAVTVLENGSLGYQASEQLYDWGDGGQDMLLFSLRKGSPTIGLIDCLQGLPIEPGDILVPPCAGSNRPGIFVAAEALGLSTFRSGGHSDELDGVDYTKDEIVDCNGNGLPDHVEIAKGLASDTNTNGIPDDCEDRFVRYCFCDPVSTCGNPASNAGCANATGMGGNLEATGSTSIFSDDLTLLANNLPPLQFGIFFLGGAPISPVPFGNGQRCVGAGPLGIFRIALRQASAQGEISLENVASQICLFPMACVEVGSLRYLQLWYRDPGGPCGSSFNLSNAIEIPFTL